MTWGPRMIRGGIGAVMLLLLAGCPSWAGPAPRPLTVVLVSGDTLQVTRVLPGGLDMVRVEDASGARYFPSIRIRTIRDGFGNDRTRDVLDRRQTVADTDSGNGGPDMARNPEHRSHAVCWRGHPAPECRSFLITEFGILERLDDYPFQRGASHVAVTFDVGWMKNVSARDAIGLSGHVLTSDPTQRVGIRARYRRWLGRNTSVDVTPGIFLSGEDNLIDYDPPGYVVGATLNAGDLMALTAEAEFARYLDYGDVIPQVPHRRHDVTWRAGAKLGSGLGLLGAAALVGLVVYVAASGGFD